MLSPTQLNQVFRELLIEYPQYQTALNNNRDLAPHERHLNLSIDQLTKFDEDLGEYLYKNPSQFVKIIEEGIRELNGNAHIQVILQAYPDNIDAIKISELTDDEKNKLVHIIGHVI